MKRLRAKSRNFFGLAIKLLARARRRAREEEGGVSTSPPSEKSGEAGKCGREVEERGEKEITKEITRRRAARGLFTYSYRKPALLLSYTLITRGEIDGFATDTVKRF